MCSPEAPEVLARHGAPSRASSSCSQQATSTTRLNGASGIGSRSSATQSASPTSGSRENHGSCEITASWGHPRQGLEGPADEIGNTGVPALEALAHRHHADPVGQLVRRPVLVEPLAVDAVGEALHDEGAVGDNGQQVRRHAQVEPHQVPLGQPRPGPEHLVQVADRDRPPVRQHEDAAPAARLQRADLLAERVDVGVGGRGRRGRGRRRRPDGARSPRPRGVGGLGSGPVRGTAPPIVPAAHVLRRGISPHAQIHGMEQHVVGRPATSPRRPGSGRPSGPVRWPADPPRTAIGRPRWPAHGRRWHQGPPR